MSRGRPIPHARRSAICLSVLLGLPLAAQADPWKDESRGRGERRGERGVIVLPAPPPPHPGGPLLVVPPPPHVAAPLVPPGHLPPPGECRLWFPDRPPGHQPPPGRC